MKTLREVLYEKHQAAEPGLDALRQRVIAGLAPGGAKRGAGEWAAGVAALEAGWRQRLWSLRWHLAGMSAAWVLALALNLDPAPASARRAAHRDAPSAEQALAALRENHRQIREMVAAPGAEPVPAPTELAPSPRSEVRPFTPTTINPAKTSIAYECA